MNEDIELKLNKISVKPLSNNEKGVLWSKIEKNMLVPEKSPYMSGIMQKFSFFRLQSSVAFSLMVAVLFGGSGIAFAYADTAAPGDILFPLSVMKEKIVISLAPTAHQNELRLQFAEKRIAQGNNFLSAIVPTSSTTRALVASQIATSTAPASTTTSAVVNNAVNRLSATIAYLQGIKADLLTAGNMDGALAIQDAIDKMITQLNVAGNQNAVVVAKIKEHKNQFKVEIQTNNGSTTVTSKINIDKRDNSEKVTITEKNNNPISNASSTARIIKEHEQKIEDSKKGEQEDDNRSLSTNKNRGGEREDEGGDNERENEHGRKNRNIPTTLPPVVSDTTAPVISALSSTPSSVSTIVLWTTSENASGKIYFGKVNPLVVASAENMMQSATLSLTHSFTLANLSTSTTYYFVVESKDTAGNTVTSPQNQFTTTS